MNTTDYHYYNSFDEIGKPFYDWERQIINLGCNVSDIDISNMKEENIVLNLFMNTYTIYRTFLQAGVHRYSLILLWL